MIDCDMDGEDSMTETLNKLVSPGRVSSHSSMFREEECEALVDLVEQNKSVLMNPLKNADACHAKDRTWTKVCRLFNARGFTVRRSVDHLRVKWENMKKTTRKKTNNLQRVCFSEHDELTRRVLALLCYASTVHPTEVEAVDDATEMDEAADSTKSGENDQQWEVYLNQNEDNDSSNQNGDDSKPAKYSRESRSLSFTPQECNMLLQCVKAERKHIFNKYTNSKANREKNHAWARITVAFNKQIVNHGRTTKVLRTKFENMKKMARAVVAGRPHNNLTATTSQHFDDGAQQSFKKEQMEEEEGEDDREESYEPPVELDELLRAHTTPAATPAPAPTTASARHEDTADPLSAVLNGYTYTESQDSSMREDPEVVRIKLELLNYQLETAKMERERVAAALESEAAEREQRQQLLTLRLREARLSLLAAEQRLPPALHYPNTTTDFPVP